VQSFRNGSGEGSVVPPFDKSGVVCFIYSYKNRYACCTPQAGQLSNLQSLAPTTRKSDILVSLSL